MVFNVTEEASYTVLYVLLSLFTLLAFSSLPSVSKKFPSFIRTRLLLPGVSNVQDESSRRDYFLSARKAAGPWAIGLSFFGEGMGSWILYVQHHRLCHVPTFTSDDDEKSSFFCCSIATELPN